jgi:hypothetical protein
LPVAVFHIGRIFQVVDDGHGVLIPMFFNGKDRPRITQGTPAVTGPIFLLGFIRSIGRNHANGGSFLHLVQKDLGNLLGGIPAKSIHVNFRKLLEWGLTEEQATKVMEGLNGSFVTKARFNEVNTELTTAKNTIKERDTQLETLKKASGDTKALQDQITQLQADNKKKDTDHAAELKNLKISNAVELALTGAKAKNNTAVKALLVDFIGKAELAEDGTVKGLDDEVKKLVEGKDTAFLFEKSTGTKFKGAKSAEKGDGAEGGMTLEKLKAMNPLDRYNYSVNHPDEYKELYGGNE